MPVHCVERIERALNRAGKAVNGSRIAILGVSYKAGVGDLRESPALRIIEVLTELGAELSYSDPYVPSLPDFGLVGAPLEEATANADAIVLVTAHPGIDHKSLAQRGTLFIDLRGATRGVTAESLVRL
jgi:UDP-N-acetyl-D-glucosamine dehydrogenase